MTPYTKLQSHLERHMYKRGRYKGEAPADHSRRAKNHFRVRRHGDTMCVVMYSTNLIEVTPDNEVRINMGGWWTSTTKDNLNEAMRRFLGWGSVGSIVYRGCRQMAFRVYNTTYRYYDGMRFNEFGKLLSEPAKFSRQCVDKDATAEFRKDIEDSGFKAVFPVLFATAEPTSFGLPPEYLRRYVTQECHANKWPDVAANTKRYFDDRKEAYRYIVRTCTRDMTLIEDTDVTTI